VNETIYMLSVWLHILAAAIWIGGMGFLVFAIVPVLRLPGLRDSAAKLIHETGMRFRRVGWICLWLLLLTGSYNMYYRGLRWGELYASDADAVTRALGYKLLLVGLTFLVSGIHDFYVGPKATLAWQEAPDSPTATAFRKRAAQLGRMNALFALAILYFAVRLVRGGVGG
jgi:uncharacterized membrane protein